MARATDSFYDALGRRIYLLRKKRKLTQEQLGARLLPPVTRASIANVESGKQRVLAHSVAQLADALGVSTDELLREKVVPTDAGLKKEVESQLRTRISHGQLRELTRKLGLTDGGDENENANQNPGRSQNRRSSNRSSEH
jgi:transcriptional regulator with XRE-family HTH domain